MKTTIALIAVLLLAGVGAYVYMTEIRKTEPAPATGPVATDPVEPMEDRIEEPDTAEPVAEQPTPISEPKSELGTSVEGHAITAYHFGTGEKELLFVGGIHGGYSWNTALVAYELIDYLEANPDVVPDNVKVTVVPVLNPDGLERVVGTTGRFTPAAVPPAEAARVPGRFNGNNVDLNRNFDCAWQADAVWQSQAVSGGDRAFSEPESRALQAYVEEHPPAAVVAWYSAAGGVYTSNCYNGVLPETATLTELYADASGYRAEQEFDYYEITGDMVNWFARKNIPGISVLLTTHEDVEWEKNKAGVDALLAHYAL